MFLSKLAGKEMEDVGGGGPRRLDSYLPFLSHRWRMDAGGREGVSN